MRKYTLTPEDLENIKFAEDWIEKAEKNPNWKKVFLSHWKR
jgi:hypothetical protein